MIYADHNGSSPLLTEVKEFLNRRINGNLFGNPSALHANGMNIRKRLEKSRSTIAHLLGAKPDQVIFTSGASEGIAQVISSILQSKNEGVILVTGLEHSSIYETIKRYKTDQHKIVELPTTKEGTVDLSAIDQYRSTAILFCLNGCNSETGVITEPPTIKFCPILYDATQLIGRESFDFNKNNIDYAVFSSHKLGALPGSGVLLAKDSSGLCPLIPGALQEEGLRGGTENYLAIETMAIALTVLYLEETKAKINELNCAKIQFEKRLLADHPKLTVFGKDAKRSYNTTYLAYAGIHGQALQIELESKGIFVSTSSACSDNEPAGAHVLGASGIPENISRGAIRISLGVENKSDDYNKISLALSEVVDKLSLVGEF